MTHDQESHRGVEEPRLREPRGKSICCMHTLLYKCINAENGYYEPLFFHMIKSRYEDKWILCCDIDQQSVCDCKMKMTMITCILWRTNSDQEERASSLTGTPAITQILAFLESTKVHVCYIIMHNAPKKVTLQQL